MIKMFSLTQGVTLTEVLQKLYEIEVAKPKQNHIANGIE